MKTHTRTSVGPEGLFMGLSLAMDFPIVHALINKLIMYSGAFPSLVCIKPIKSSIKLRYFLKIKVYKTEKITLVSSHSTTSYDAPWQASLVGFVHTRRRSRKPRLFSEHPDWQLASLHGLHPADVEVSEMSPGLGFGGGVLDVGRADAGTHSPP